MEVAIIKGEIREVKVGDVLSIVNAYEGIKATNYLVYKHGDDTIGFLNLETSESVYRISNRGIDSFTDTLLNDHDATEWHWFDGESEVKLTLKRK